MTFTAKYNADGSVKAGSFSDGTSWDSIPEVSRFWPELMELTNNGADIVAYVPPPSPPSVLPKLTLWERLTDAEASQITAAMTQQSAKMQGIWSSASEIRSDSPWYGDLKAFLVAVVGDARAEALLSP